jgi:hypothetical protein
MCRRLIRTATGHGSGQRRIFSGWSQAVGAAVCALLLTLCTLPTHAQSCATPGNDGNAVVSGVINTYWPGTSNPGNGATSLVLGSARGASVSIAAGDLVLILQMQDANINSGNNSSYGDGTTGDPGSGTTNLRRAGRFEFSRAANNVGLGGGTLLLSAPTQFNYSTQAATNARGQRRFQVVRVPQYATLTLAGNLTALAWDGDSGGVVAADVAGELNMNGQIVDASGTGFRGGGGRGSTTGSGASSDYRTPSTTQRAIPTAALPAARPATPVGAAPTATRPAMTRTPARAVAAAPETEALAATPGALADRLSALNPAASAEPVRR